MSRGRRVGFALSGVIATALVLGYFGWVVPTRRAVDIGAGMLAKQICSCIYVAGRGLDDCRADQFETMDPIEVEVIDADARVRAWIPGLGDRAAVHRQGLGCTLE